MSEHPECRVIAQARCAGPVPTAIRAVSGRGFSEDETHIAIRFGAVLFYLEDQDAFEALVEIVDRAADWAELVFATVDPAASEGESERPQP